MLSSLRLLLLPLAALLLLMACSAPSSDDGASAGDVDREAITSAIDSMDDAELARRLWENDVPFMFSQALPDPGMPALQVSSRVSGAMTNEPFPSREAAVLDGRTRVLGHVVRKSDGAMSNLEFSGVVVRRDGDRVSVSGDYTATFTSPLGRFGTESAIFGVGFERMGNGLYYTSAEAVEYMERAREAYLARLESEREN